MSRVPWVVAGSALALLGSAALFTQSQNANASTASAASADADDQAPTAPGRLISRRERMARIVAEQAAISAEVAARKALAQRAAEEQSASR